MSVQLVLFVVAIVAFIAAAACAGFAVYVFRAQDIPAVRADLAGELSHVGPASGVGGSRRRGKRGGESAAADELRSASAMAADDTPTALEHPAKPDDSATRLGAGEGSSTGAEWPSSEKDIGFKVVRREVDVHSAADIASRK